MSKAGSG